MLFICVCMCIPVRACVSRDARSTLSTFQRKVSLHGLVRPLLVTVHQTSLTAVGASQILTWTPKTLKDNLFLAPTCLGFPYRCLLPKSAGVFQSVRTRVGKCVFPVIVYGPFFFKANASGQVCGWTVKIGFRWTRSL